MLQCSSIQNRVVGFRAFDRKIHVGNVGRLLIAELSKDSTFVAKEINQHFFAIRFVIARRRKDGAELCLTNMKALATYCSHRPSGCCFSAYRMKFRLCTSIPMYTTFKRENGEICHLRLDARFAPSRRVPSVEHRQVNIDYPTVGILATLLPECGGKSPPAPEPHCSSYTAPPPSSLPIGRRRPRARDRQAGGSPRPRMPLVGPR